MSALIHKFVVDNHAYELKIEGTHIDLYLVTGAADRFDRFGEVRMLTDTVNEGINAHAVFRKTITLIEAWVYTAKPGKFSFSTPEAKKADVYEKMITRYLQTHKKFKYVVTRDGGTFWFYKEK